MNPVRLSDGTLFRSESAAARHFKVNVSTIGYHLDRGTLDRLVVGGQPATFSKVPCSFDGVEYGSVREAARALGISPQAVSLRLKAANKRGGLPSNFKPCVYDGVEYPSLAAAARDVGMSPEAFRQRLLRRERLIERVKKEFGYWPTEDGGMPEAQSTERMAAE